MSLPFSKYAHKTARAEYVIHVSVRFKHVRDTIKECKFRRQVYQPYVNGVTEPHFPVPAIRESFEFGWSLSDSQPTLIHMVQGRYS
jgi:hypothetical protein